MAYYLGIPERQLVSSLPETSSLYLVMNIFISPKLVVQYIHDKARTKLT